MMTMIFFTEELPDLNLNLPKTKRLPNKSEFENLLNCKQELGYYNGSFCKIYDKKLVLPFYKHANCYLSNIDKLSNEYLFLSLEPNGSCIIDGCSDSLLIRSIQIVPQPKSAKGELKESGLQNKESEKAKLPDKPEPLIINNNLVGNIEIEIVDIINRKGLLTAVKYYKDKTGLDLKKSKDYVDGIVRKHNLKSNTRNSGCMVSLTLIIISIIVLYII